MPLHEYSKTSTGIVCRFWKPVPLSLLIFVAAFALRIALTSQFVGLASAPDRNAGGLDVVDYEGFAWSIAEGHGYSLPSGAPTARRAPGTSFTLVPVYVLFGHSYLVAHVWFCFVSALTCVATFWLAEMIAGINVAALAGFALAVYPGHFHAAMHFFSEVPFALALTVALAGTVRAFDRRSVLWAIFAGIGWGIAVLSRPNLVIELPIAAIWLIVLPECRSIRCMRVLAVVALAAATTITPWVVRNSIVMGKASVATVIGGYTFWGANNELVLRNPALRGSWVFGSQLVDRDHPLPKDEASAEKVAWQYGLDFVRKHWEQMPSLIFVRLDRLVTPFEETPNRLVYWFFALAWLVTAPFACLGLVVLYRRHRINFAIMITPLLATVATAAIFYGCIRFRDSVSPVLVTLAAMGAASVIDRLRAASFRTGAPHKHFETPRPR